MLSVALPEETERPSVPLVTLLTTRVTAIDAVEAGSLIASWATCAVGRAICAANVHMVMEAWDDPSFAATLTEADLVVCDGRPFVRASRLLGVRGARQARGLDMMLASRVRVAPVWMQQAGVEWLFRLFSEPRRLWRRYARHNGRFVALIARQSLLVVLKRGPTSAH